MAKKYRIKTACPQCGCSGITNMSEKEMKERYGDLPNMELECHECLAALDTEIEED